MTIDRRTELLLHGTAIALGSAAALIRGPSGSGKSDLALRCLALDGSAWAGHRVALVSDDQVRVDAETTAAGLILQLSAPATIAGKLEVRGIGIVEVTAVPSARLALAVDLVPASAIERMPEPILCEIEGVTVPRLLLAPFEPSSPLKLILALKLASKLHC